MRYPLTLVPDVLDTKEDFLAGAMANMNTPLRVIMNVKKLISYLLDINSIVISFNDFQEELESHKKREERNNQV